MGPSQSATKEREWGLRSVRGCIYPGYQRFRPPVVGVEHVWNISEPGMGPYSVRVRRNIDVGPTGSFPSFLDL